MPQLLHKMFIFEIFSKNNRKKRQNTIERMLNKGFLPAARTRQVYKFGILCTLCHCLSQNYFAKIMMIFSDMSQPDIAFT